jgi:cobalt-zinc-cadmium efflux system outer membrane protein
LLSVLVFPISAGGARAVQAAPDSSNTQVIELRWPDVVRLVDRHPSLAAAKFRTEAARGAVTTAGSVPNPSLDGTLGHGRAQVGGATRVEWGLTVNIPLGWIAQRRSKIDAAEAEVTVTEAENALLRRDVLLQLRTLFWNLAYEQERVASFEALGTQTATLAYTVKRRVEKGEVRPVEGTRVEIELEKIYGELDGARSALASRQATFALWFGAPAGSTIAVRVDLGQLPVFLALDAALAKVQQAHPALIAAHMRERASAADLARERRARVPDFSLVGFTTSELDRRSLGAGFAARLPLWDWNRGGIAEAEAKLAGSRKQREAMRLELEGAVIEAQSDCQVAVLLARRFGDNVVPRSISAAATMERTYQLGEVGLLEVIDARRTLIESRRLHLNALAQAQISCSRLGVLVGEDLP